MPRFITRVELYGEASEEDYNSLHKAMKSRGFSREIINEKGPAHILPTAMYHCIGIDLNIDDVYAEAWGSANSQWPRCAVLVVQVQDDLIRFNCLRTG